MKKTFALYRGDQFIDLGTIKYLANLLGVKERTIKFYSTPHIKKEIIIMGMLLLGLRKISNE